MTYKLIGFQESCAVVLNVDANSPEHALEIAQKTNPHINFQMPENYSTTATPAGDKSMFGFPGEPFDEYWPVYSGSINSHGNCSETADSVGGLKYATTDTWNVDGDDLLLFGNPLTYQTPPHIVNKFVGVQDEQLDLFEKKHADYGRDNIMSGDAGDPVAKTEALLSIYVRMQDKLNRLKRLIDSIASVKDETVRDTLLDLANYATIGTVVYDGEWKDG